MKPAQALAIILLSLFATPTAAAPLEAYGRLPSAEHVEISPDGSKIMMVVSTASDRQLQIRNAADLKLLTVLRVGDTKIIALQWAGLDHLIITAGVTADVMGLTGPRSQYWMPTILDVNTGKAVNPLATDADIDAMFNRNPATRRLDSIYAIPQPLVINGKPVVYLLGVSFPGEKGVLTFYRADLNRSATRPIEVVAGDEDTDDMLVDGNGRLVARSDYNESSGEWRLFVSAGGSGIPHQVHRETAPIDRPSLAGFGRDKNSVIVEKDENDVPRYHEMPLSGTDWSAPIAALDGAELIHDPVSRTVIGGIRYNDLSYDYAFLDPADQEIWDKVVKAFPGEVVSLSSWSDDRSKVILHVEGPKNGDAYYLLDRTTRHADWLFDQYQDVKPEDFNEVRVINYPAADGMNIPAYLTLPRGRPAKNLPLIVVPHGGPEARDDPGFDWWAQAIASLGYAVLQPQFRGSSGISAGFIQAGYGQWGHKMQTDLSDGVHFLAQNGTIDPARVCIVGASYGGYAAMAGVTLQSGIYRCAVSVSGVSDLRRHLLDVAQQVGGTDNSTRRYYLRFLGAKDRSDPVLDEISPAKHADKLSAPLLLIHGTIDTVVQPSQSKVMQQAAAQAGKTVQLVTLAGEDHNLFKGATRLQMLQAMADFLKVNLPVDPPAQTAAK